MALLPGPTWLRRPAQAAGFGRRGRREAERVGRERAAPVEGRWTSKSNCAASGRAEGE